MPTICCSFLTFNIEIRGPQAILDMLQREYGNVGALRNPRVTFTITIHQRTRSFPASPQPYHFDPASGILRLIWLDGAINVEVDYTARHVEAWITRSVQTSAAIANWVITIPLSELLRPFDYHFIHAAGLVREGRGILFGGRSGQGKTTLALGLIEQGWTLISDDDLFITPTPDDWRVVSGPEPVKATPQTAARFPQWCRPLSAATGKQRVSLPPACRIAELNGGLIAVGFITPAERTRWRRLTPRAAYERLLNLAWLPAHPDYSRRTLAVLHRLVHTLTPFELHFGLDFADLSNQLAAIIGEITRP